MEKGGIVPPLKSMCINRELHSYCGFGAPTGHVELHAPQSTQTSALIS
jgi:hypothetical protein